MANRADILAGEAYVQMDLDDQQYAVAMKLAMQQLKQFERSASVVVRSLKTLEAGFTSVASKVRGFGRLMSTAIGSVSKFSRLIFDTLAPAMFFLGAAAAGFGAAVLRAVQPAAKAFANLEDVVSRFRITFGQAAPAAERWGRSFARAIGYADSTILDVMGRFQALLTTQGVPAQVAQVASSGLAQLVPNLASFFEQRPEEVITRLFSGLVGEMEAVRRLGIDLSAAAVNRQLQAFGIDPKLATSGQKAIARYNIIVEQSKLAQNDLAVTADSLANTVVRMNEAWKRTSETIGQALAPALTSLANILTQVLERLRPVIESTQFAKFATGVVAAAGGLFSLGTAAVAIAPLVTAFGSLASFATALAGAVATGLTASIVGALGAAKAFTVALSRSWQLLLKIGQAGALKGALGRSLTGIAGSIASAARGGSSGFARSATTIIAGGTERSGTYLPGLRELSGVSKAARDAAEKARQAQAQVTRIGLGWARMTGTVDRFDVSVRDAAAASRQMATAAEATTKAQRGAEKAWRLLTRSEQFRSRQAGVGVPGLRQQILSPAEINADIARRVELDRPRIGILEQLRRASFPEDALRSRVVASGATGGPQGPSLLARAFTRIQPAINGLSRVASGFAGVLRAIGPVVVEVGKRFAYLLVAFRAIGRAITPITLTIGDAFSRVVQAGKQVIGTVGAVAVNLLQVGRVMGVAFGSIIDLLVGGNVQGAASVAVASWQYLQTVVSESATQVGTAFSELFSAIGASLSEMIKGAQYLAHILTNPLEAVATGQRIRSAESQAARDKTIETLERTLRASGQLGVGESVSRNQSFTRNGDLRNVTIEDGNGIRSRAVQITEDQFIDAEATGARLAKSFALNLAKEARNSAIAQFGPDVGRIGESIGEAFARVSSELNDSPAVQAALQNLRQAIDNAGNLAGQGGTVIPGANPQLAPIPAGLQESISKSVAAVANAGQSIRRIAQTTGLGDAGARSRFLSRDNLAVQIQQQQLDVLKKIEDNTSAPPLRLEGASL